MYLFIHIPKNAGTTFNSILIRNFGDGYIPLYASKKEGFLSDSEINAIASLFTSAKCAASHDFRCPISQPYNVDIRYELLTFLRDPADRALSTYFYQKKQVKMGINKEYTDLPFEDYFNKVMDKGYKSSGNIYSYLCNMQAYYLDSSYDMNQIKKRMRDDFFFIGITERFDESLMILKKKLESNGVRFHINYTQKNASKRLNSKKYLKEKTYNHVLHCNEMDNEIHSYANHLLNMEIESYGKSFHNDLINFKKTQMQWGIVHNIALNLYKLTEYSQQFIKKYFSNYL